MERVILAALLLPPPLLVVLLLLSLYTAADGLGGGDRERGYGKHAHCTCSG